MTLTGKETVSELMARFPGGFSVGPGTPESPGVLSRIVAASSHLSKVVAKYPMPPDNGGYLVVDMGDERG
jgi:hypothetical protein